MRTLGSVASVIASIDAEAEEQAERLRQASRESVELLGGRPEEPLSLPEREARLLDAHRQARRLLGEEQWLDRKERIEGREQWLGAIVVEANERLRKKKEREVFERLAREALSKLPAVPCELVVSPEAAGWFDAAWCQRVAGESGKPLVGVIGGPDSMWGCTARTGDGRMEFDNGLEARSRRLEPVWRRALLEIYERSS